MSFNRTSLLNGPAKVEINAANLFAEGNITAAFETDREDRGVDAFGALARPISDKRIVTSLQPTQWENLATLFPYASTQLGVSIYGAVDTPAVITPVNGAPLTIANAAITQMPGIRLSAIGSQFTGDLQITGLIANNSEPDSIASYYAMGTPATGVPLTGLDISKLLNGSYSASFNGNTYFAEEAFEIEFDLQLEPRVVDGHGTVDMIFAGLDVSCRFVPLGLTETELLALRGWDSGIGSEPARHQLVISAGVGKPKITLNNCSVDPSQLTYGATEQRNGEVEFRTCRTVAAGVLEPVFVVETETV